MKFFIGLRNGLIISIILWAGIAQAVQLTYNIPDKNVQKIIDSRKNLSSFQFYPKDIWNEILIEHPGWTDAQIAKDSIRRTEILLIKAYADELGHQSINNPLDNTVIE